MIAVVRCRIVSAGLPSSACDVAVPEIAVHKAGSRSIVGEHGGTRSMIRAHKQAGSVPYPFLLQRARTAGFSRCRAKRDQLPVLPFSGGVSPM